MSLFEHALPIEAATKKPPPKGKPSDGKGKKPPEKDRGPVHTQMKGEKPGDDLGYDPKIIPVEEIE